MIELKLFHAPLKYKVLDNIDNKVVSDYCYNYQKNNPSREVSNIGGYQSDDLKGDIPEFYDIFKNIIQLTCEEFAKNGKTDEFRPYISNSWININQPNTYNTLHDHPKSFYSFVYYVKVPPNSGNINFHHPSPTIGHTWEGNHFKDDRHMEDTVCFRIWKQPVNGLLVMFPSWLKHSVDINGSNEDRISIAVNTHIDKI
tara:strand:- start:3087 stop:3683 length:597 start_codon:yes stop_codon:yes gene_type:complete